MDYPRGCSHRAWISSALRNSVRRTSRHSSSSRGTLAWAFWHWWSKGKINQLTMQPSFQKRDYFMRILNYEIGGGKRKEGLWNDIEYVRVATSRGRVGELARGEWKETPVEAGNQEVDQEVQVWALLAQQKQQRAFLKAILCQSTRLELNELGRAINHLCHAADSGLSLSCLTLFLNFRKRPRSNPSSGLDLFIMD